MSTLNMLILMCVFTASVVLFLFLFFPEGTSRVKKIRKKAKNMQLQGKDWKRLALRLERYIYTLREQREKLRNQQKKASRDLVIEKARTTKLQERLVQEKKWLDKEKDSLIKKNEELHKIKVGMHKAEEDCEKEYGIRLKLERELKDCTQDLKALEARERILTSKLMKSESQLASDRKEVVELKRINAQLTKESDEANWIAKSEYEKLEKLLKGKDKEIERLDRKD